MSKEPVQPIIAMPSADLVTFRFDQTDKNIAMLDKKMDTLVNNFATKEEVAAVNNRLNNWVWYWRAVFTGLLVVGATTLAALIHKGG